MGADAPCTDTSFPSMRPTKPEGVPCARIGTVRRNSDSLAIKLATAAIKAPLARLRRAYHDTIPLIMSRTPEHATFDELAPVAAH